MLVVYNVNSEIILIMVQHYTVELQWLRHLWNHENVFETGVVQATEC